MVALGLIVGANCGGFVPLQQYLRRLFEEHPALRCSVVVSGILTLLLWRSAPSNWILLALLLSVIACSYWRTTHWLAVWLFGVLWGAVAVYQSERALLPEQLDRSHFQLGGMIVSPVFASAEYWQFDLRVEQLQLVESSPAAGPSDHADVAAKRRGTVRLRLYRRGHAATESLGEQLRAGQYLSAQVTLRTPRGLANPGLFNYRTWLRSRGYIATGYIRGGSLSAAPPAAAARLDSRLTAAVAALRQRLLETVAEQVAAPLPRALLAALAVGDKSALAPWRERIVALGIIHLLVISGLHIGMVGALGWWLGSAAARALAAWHSRRGCESRGLLAADLLPPLTAVLLALGYTLLSGGQLPALRALIALCWLAVASAQRLDWEPLTLLSRVVLTILLVDPLAVISASFWLSLSAVALLMVALVPRREIVQPQQCDPPVGKLLRGWRQLLRVQFYLTLGMAPLLLALIGKLSLVGLLVNLFAVPWVTLLLVPAVLLAVAGSLLLPPLAPPLWALAAQLSRPVAAVVEQLQVEAVILPLDQIASPVWLLLLLFWLAAVLPRPLLSWPLRLLFTLPLLLALALGPTRPPLRVTVLDVGQGLAVVVEAAGRVLLYDSGARYSEYFDMGSAVVVPYLHRRGYQRLDRVVISHGDNDHLGGYSAVAAALQPTVVLLPDELLGAAAGQRSCQQPQRWQWGEVRFTTIGNRSDGSRNDDSCLLLLQWGVTTVLLPGDIERRAEQRLLAEQRLPAALTVLVAPHHGSNSSSSAALLERLRPDHVVFSAGWNHHYGHPHPQVLARYQAIGSRSHHTGTSGAITFSWDRDGALTVERLRSPNQRWWQ